jgi:hypothetical protein
MLGDPVLLRNTSRLGVRRDRANLHSSTFLAESGVCQRSVCRVDTQVFSITFKIFWESLGGPAHRSGTGERIRRRKLESPAASRSPGFVVVSSAINQRTDPGNSRAKRWVSSGLKGGWGRGWDSNPCAARRSARSCTPPPRGESDPLREASCRGRAQRQNG